MKTRSTIHELRRQRSVTHTNLSKWQAKSEAKVTGYVEKLERLEAEITELEKGQ